MGITDLYKRRNEILQAIIEAYIASASPVGSEFLSRRLRPSLSPATIRHVMAELEEEGLLEQPHTSAGRVPTDRGYRLYVDTMMGARALSPGELEQIASLIEPEEPDLGQLLAHANAVLADLAQEAAFSVAPTVKRSTVKQVELVPLSLRKLLCVLVASDEMVASHVVEMAEPMSREEASALARFITTELVGLPFNELLSSLERRVLAETDSFYHVVKRSLDILQDALSTEPEERFLMEGASHLIAQPEFRRDSRKTVGLLQGLDEARAQLAERIRQDLAAEGTRVRIGRELEVEGLEDCSYVAAPFRVRAEVMGGIGVLGPRRMDYPRSRALVDGVSRVIMDCLGRWSG